MFSARVARFEEPYSVEEIFVLRLEAWAKIEERLSIGRLIAAHDMRNREAAVAVVRRLRLLRSVGVGRCIVKCF